MNKKFFWQQAYLTALGCHGVTHLNAVDCADKALAALLERFPAKVNLFGEEFDS